MGYDPDESAEENKTGYSAVADGSQESSGYEPAGGSEATGQSHQTQQTPQGQHGHQQQGGEMSYEDALAEASSFYTKRAAAVIVDIVPLFLPTALFALFIASFNVPGLAYAAAGFVFYLFKTIPEAIWQQNYGKRYMNLKIATKENEQPERWKVFVRNIPFIFVPIWQLGILVLPIQWLFIRWTRFSQRPLDRLLGIYVIDVPPQEQMRRTTWLQKAISGFRS